MSTARRLRSRRMRSSAAPRRRRARCPARAAVTWCGRRKNVLHELDFFTDRADREWARGHGAQCGEREEALVARGGRQQRIEEEGLVRHVAMELQHPSAARMRNRRDAPQHALAAAGVAVAPGGREQEQQLGGRAEFVEAACETPPSLRRRALQQRAQGAQSHAELALAPRGRCARDRLQGERSVETTHPIFECRQRARLLHRRHAALQRLRVAVGIAHRSDCRGVRSG
mmetsp:Transcript_85770/g.256917  ORF Transcript_85770/g.256917 Transcript_85770/m.256917 type:complete len:229 (+) Transcript_85770:383-1069(+)